MAEAIGMASAIVGLITFAIESSVTLCTLVRKLQNQEKNSRQLKADLNDLIQVLQTLLETVSTHPQIDFTGLTKILERCGKSCQEYGELIAECTKHSNGSKASLRDWWKQQYLQGDLDDFKATLAVYKSTINISLANANIRIAAVTPAVVEEYKDMLKDTTDELREHFQSLQEKVEALVSKGANEPGNGDVEWQAILEEKETTQLSLKVCAQLSDEIEKWETTSKEHPSFSERPSSKKIVKTVLDPTKSSLQNLLTQLQNHENDIDKQIEAMRSTSIISDSVAVQLARLEETKGSIAQCLQVVGTASDNLAVRESNLSEDVNVEDRSYKVSVSTVGALFTLRGVRITGRSRYITGQVSDESYQKTIERLTELDLKYEDSSSTSRPGNIGRNMSGNSATNEFDSRFGRGRTFDQVHTQ